MGIRVENQDKEMIFNRDFYCMNVLGGDEKGPPVPGSPSISYSLIRYNGIFPCFFLGMSTTLFSSMA